MTRANRSFNVVEGVVAPLSAMEARNPMFVQDKTVADSLNSGNTSTDCIVGSTLENILVVVVAGAAGGGELEDLTMNLTDWILWNCLPSALEYAERDTNLVRDNSNSSDSADADGEDNVRRKRRCCCNAARSYSKVRRWTTDSTVVVAAAVAAATEEGEEVD